MVEGPLLIVVQPKVVQRCSSWEVDPLPSLLGFVALKSWRQFIGDRKRDTRREPGEPADAKMVRRVVGVVVDVWELKLNSSGAVYSVQNYTELFTAGRLVSSATLTTVFQCHNNSGCGFDCAGFHLECRHRLLHPSPTCTLVCTHV